MISIRITSFKCGCIYRYNTCINVFLKCHVYLKFRKPFFIPSEAFTGRAKHKFLMKAKNVSFPQVFSACLSDY